MDYGAAIVNVNVPDRDGRMADVVTGFDEAAPYAAHDAYFGAIVGRYANRIANGQFTLDGKEYRLSTNNENNTLHGGAKGFSHRFWNARAATHTDSDEIGGENSDGVALTLISADGDQGFPGQVTITATYVWTDDHRLIIDYTASATKPTPFNISQHSYWNLNGTAYSGSVLDHILQIHADGYLPVNENMIPQGDIASVTGTPFDFRDPKPIGRDINQNHVQLERAGGYDHNWVLNGDGMRKAAMLFDPASGRKMAVTTDQPGLQCYTSNFLDGETPGKDGKRYNRRSTVALETQHFPDSPNRPEFPDTILRPGQDFTSRTVYAFSAI